MNKDYAIIKLENKFNSKRGRPKLDWVINVDMAIENWDYQVVSNKNVRNSEVSMIQNNDKRV